MTATPPPAPPSADKMSPLTALSMAERARLTEIRDLDARVMAMLTRSHTTSDMLRDLIAEAGHGR